MIIQLPLDTLDQEFLIELLDDHRSRDKRAIEIVDRIRELANPALKLSLVLPYGSHLPQGAPFIFRVVRWYDGDSTPAGVQWGKRKYEPNTTKGVIELKVWPNDVIRWGWQQPDKSVSVMRYGVVKPDGRVLLIPDRLARPMFVSGGQAEFKGERHVIAEDLFKDMPTVDNPNPETTCPLDATENLAGSAQEDAASWTKTTNQENCPTGPSTPPATADDAVPNVTSTT